MGMASGGGGGTRRQHAEERREQILDAAIRVCAQKGFSAASMRDIAREVGVTEGLLYHYFASKDELLHACWKERSWYAHLQRILGGAVGRPVGAVLREIARDFLDTLYEHRESVRVTNAEMQYNAELARFHTERIQEAQRSLVEFLGSRQTAGEIRPDVTVEAVAGLLMGTAHSLFMLWNREEPEQWGKIVDWFVEHTTDAILKGALHG